MAKSTTANDQAAMTAAASGFPMAPGTYQMQPAPPEFLAQIAAALEAGYGAGNQRAYLDTIYRPMTFPSFQAVGAPAAAPVAAPAASGGLGAVMVPQMGGPLAGMPIEQMISRQFSAGGQY